MRLRRLLRDRKAKKPMLHETWADTLVSKDGFSVHDGEGRLEKKILPIKIIYLGIFFSLCMAFLVIRISFLQVVSGEEYYNISENNTFDQRIVFPHRGSILDRNGEALAWNHIEEGEAAPLRYYRGEGFGSLLGFVRYPERDSSGIYYRDKTIGVGGIEKKFDEILSGELGSLVLERNASGNELSELYLKEPVDGEDVQISIDADIQEAMYAAVKDSVIEKDFAGGAGVLLDIETGEIISLVSYPDFDNNIFTNYTSEERKEFLEERTEGDFIHRSVSGLYAPGSTIKPFFAIAALEEDIIKPQTTIISTGKITLRSPYDPDIVYTYKDWKALGALDLYKAIALSSNIYFYHIGGGYAHIEEGLGIDRINYYARIFGLNRKTNLGIFDEPAGLVPNPEWKENRFGEQWTIGDTYNTVIGQYAFQVTPLQMARAVAAIANGGFLVEPHLEKGKISEKITLILKEENIKIVQDAMRKTITEGTGGILASNDYVLAVKTGTAQIGTDGLENSLLVGFFPYQAPKYAFVIVMDRGRVGAGLSTAKQFFDSMALKNPEFLK